MACAFPEESAGFVRLGAVEPSSEQELQRDPAVEFRVVGRVDDAHPTYTELAQDYVAANEVTPTDAVSAAADRFRSSGGLDCIFAADLCGNCRVGRLRPRVVGNEGVFAAERRVVGVCHAAGSYRRCA